MGGEFDVSNLTRRRTAQAGLLKPPSVYKLYVLASRFGYTRHGCALLPLLAYRPLATKLR
jgi:hypothetical protein